MTLHRAIASLIFAIVGLLVARVGHADEVKLEGFGGRGGSAFRLDCGADGAIVGLNVRAAEWIDAVQVVCRKFDSSGNPVGQVYTRGFVGGASGAPASGTCPQGSVVGGLAGTWGDSLYGSPAIRSGDFVHSLDLECRKWNPSTQKFDRGAVQRINALKPGKSSLAMTDTRGWCPVDAIATAVEGRSGIYLDYIVLVCNRPVTIANVTLQSDGTRKGRPGIDQVAPQVVTIDCPGKVEAPPKIAGPDLEFAVVGWPNLRFYKATVERNQLICSYVTANDRATQPDQWRYARPTPAGLHCAADNAAPRFLCTKAAENKDLRTLQPPQPRPPR